MMAVAKGLLVRPATVWLAGGAVLVVTMLSILAGALVAGRGPIAPAILIGVPFVIWLATSHPGIAVGGLLLAALNGFPLINIESGAGGLQPTDIALIGVWLIAITQWLRFGQHRRPLPASLRITCALFGAWWLWILVRSLNAGVPLTDAFFFGRDFLSLILLIPPAWWILQGRTAWRQCVIVVLIGSGAYGLAYVAAAGGAVSATSFVHPQLLGKVGNLPRIYTPMSDLLNTVTVFGASVLLTTRKTRATPLLTVITAIGLAAFVLQLTRAVYLGMSVAILIGIAVALTRGPQIRQTFRRRSTASLLALVIAWITVASFVPHSTATILNRISSGSVVISEESGTLGYRLNVYHSMIGLLGSRWPVGLGFLHPKDRYFPDLPSGTIRNADVGFMNAIMTMGVIGLMLLLGILLAFARHIMKLGQLRPAWLAVGLLAWLTLLLVTSPTLITLFSPTGLLSTALTLVLCATATSAAWGAPD